MCMDEKCGRIDIIEIYDDIKVVLHYEKDGDKPFFIQYWDNSQPYFRIPAKKIALEFELKIPPKKLFEIGEDVVLEAEIFSGF